ncbi:MAG: tetratricopeptide repeat protein [Opitutaceae bacterium]
MGEILKFPGDAVKLGYSRVRKRVRRVEDPNQLDLFLAATARFSSSGQGQSLFEQALLSDERGDLQAAELYTKAIESQDCVPDAFCNLGIIESKKGNTAKAFDCFTTSLKHDPRHSEAHYNLANLYFELNDFRLAQIHYEMAAEVDPSFANIFFNLALVQSINNEPAAATKTLLSYQKLVSPDEARHADELLHTLRQTLAATRGSRLGV